LRCVARSDHRKEIAVRAARNRVAANRRWEARIVDRVTYQRWAAHLWRYLADVDLKHFLHEAQAFESSLAHQENPSIAPRAPDARSPSYWTAFVIVQVAGLLLSSASASIVILYFPLCGSLPCQDIELPFASFI
jgi:hypothetical protein